MNTRTIEISVLIFTAGLWLLTGCVHQSKSSSRINSPQGHKHRWVMDDPVSVGSLVGECSLEVSVEAVRFTSNDDGSQVVGALIGGSAVSVFVPLSKVNQAVAELADLIPLPPVVVDQSSEVYRVDYSAVSGISVKRDYSGSIVVRIYPGEHGVWYCNGTRLKEFRDLLVKVEEALSQ